MKLRDVPSAIRCSNGLSLLVLIATSGTSTDAGMSASGGHQSRRTDMEQDLGRHIVRSVFRAERELEELLQFLKQNLDAQEYVSYERGIAAAIDAINVQVLKNGFSRPSRTNS
jgi:hypothetical protein